MTDQIRLPIPEYPRQLSSILWVELDHELLADWLRSSPNTSFQTEPGPQDLNELLRMVDPKQNSGPRSTLCRYIVFPAGRWTGLVTTHDFFSVRAVTRSHQTKLVELTWETVENNFPGGRVFSVYQSTQPITPYPIRDVRVIKDGRWSYETYGDPLPFEDLDAYQSKKISDRLTGPQLMSYATALGIPDHVDLHSSYALTHYFQPGPISPVSETSNTPAAGNQNPFTATDNLNLPPQRPLYPHDLEIGSLLSVDEFFTTHTNEDDIGCNLEHHPGIAMFRSVLTGLASDPSTARLAMHVSDTDEDGYPFCDAVFLMTMSVAVADATARALSAELLKTDDMAPPPPPFDNPPPGQTTVCLWWD